MDSPGPVPRFRVAAALAAAGFLLSLLWTVNLWGGEYATLVFSDIANMVAPSAAGVACLLAGRRLTAHARRAWNLLGAACFSWALGEVAWSYYELVRGQEVPFPSLADIGYLGLIPLAAAAVFEFRTGRLRSLSFLRGTLEGLTVAGSFLFVSWTLVLGRVYATFSGTLLERAIGLAYPLGDVAIVTVLVIIASLATPQNRVPFVLVASGLSAIAFADSAFAYLTAAGTYYSGSPIDVGWILGFLLIGLGALRVDQIPAAADSGPGPVPLIASILPLAPFTLAIAVAVQQEIAHGFLDPFLFWTALLTIVFVAAHQTLTLVDNLRLAGKAGAAYRELQSLEKLRLQILNNIVHDLRSPLTPISIQLHLMQRLSSDLPEPARQSLAVIQRNLEHIRLLVADLQDVAKLESGELRLHKKPVELSRLVRHSVESFKEEANQRRLTIDVEVHEPIPVHADDVRLNQVLYNLVTNALKFTPSGGSVKVRSIVSDGHARVEVRDSGRGLLPDEISRLFQPFSQTHHPDEVKERGTGLGLFISRGIVEQHGGRIWAESPGRALGSTFCFELPLDHSPAANAPPTGPHSSAG